jgi:hypothetical protein
MTPFASTLLHLQSILAIAAILVMSSCSAPPAEKPKTGLPPGSWWTAAPVSGSPKIVISLEEQRVALFKGAQLVGLSPISSGREGHDTHAGLFRISEKDENHRSSIYGAYVDSRGNVIAEDVDVRTDPPPPGTHFLGADMHWFMRINGAIGMHHGYLPGYPASHGCIRLPGTMASLFFHATPHGTPVQISDNAALISLHPEEAPSLPAVEMPVTPPAAITVAAAKPTPAAPPAAITATAAKPTPAAPPAAIKPITGLLNRSSKASTPKPPKRKRPRPGDTLYWDGIQ